MNQNIILIIGLSIDYKLTETNEWQLYGIHEYLLRKATNEDSSKTLTFGGRQKLSIDIIRTGFFVRQINIFKAVVKISLKKSSQHFYVLFHSVALYPACIASGDALVVLQAWIAAMVEKILKWWHLHMGQGAWLIVLIFNKLHLTNNPTKSTW